MNYCRVVSGSAINHSRRFLFKYLLQTPTRNRPQSAVFVSNAILPYYRYFHSSKYRSVVQGNVETNNTTSSPSSVVVGHRNTKHELVSGNITRMSPPTWLVELPTQQALDPTSWPPHRHASEFPWEKPTNIVYKRDDDDDVNGKNEEMKATVDPTNSSSTPSSRGRLFTPDFFAARKKLDYTYHANPVEHRQLLQDMILKRVINANATLPREEYEKSESKNGDPNGNSSGPQQTQQHKIQQSSNKRKRWILFSAGAMAAGKGYVMTKLSQKGLLPLETFVQIDPDLLKSELPEMAGYLQKDRNTAATQLHRESTQMADVLFEDALLRHDRNILVDGSLRDVEYYSQLFDRIRTQYPDMYRIGIIHVTASRDVIYERAKQRAKHTGRVVPTSLLDASMEQVPRSVEALSNKADVVYTISNNEGQPLELVSTIKRIGGNDDSFETKNVANTWSDFARTWYDEDDNDDDEEEQQQGDEVTTTQASSTTSCSLSPGICTMEHARECTDTMGYVTSLYAKAYPNICPGCRVSADIEGHVCGVCIHGRHICACNICNTQEGVTSWCKG